MITVLDLLQHSADLDTVFKKLHFLRPYIWNSVGGRLNVNTLFKIKKNLRVSN